MVLILAQLFGYMAAKFIGVRMVPRVQSRHRVPAIFGMVVFSNLTLLGPALVPAPFGAVFLILNGLSLGMVWGLLFGCIEGRRITDLLSVMLTLALVASTGVTKGAALALRSVTGCTELWMPFLTGLAFLPLLLVSLRLLTKLPQKTARDREYAGLRTTMDAAGQRAFMKRWGPGIAGLVGVAALLTLFRDVRETFMADIFRENGVSLDFSKLAGTELLVALCTGLPFFFIRFMKDSRRAFAVCSVATAAGAVLMGVTTLMHARGALGTQEWLVLAGIGLYLGYLPFYCVLPDRLYATLRTPGTVTFIIAQADAYGYLLSAFVVLFKALVSRSIHRTSILTDFAYATALLVPITILIAMRYFLRRTAALPPETTRAEAV